jgi:hypothetical protein
MEYRLTTEQQAMLEELIPHEEMGELAKQVYQAWLPALPERFHRKANQSSELTLFNAGRLGRVQGRPAPFKRSLENGEDHHDI